MVTPSTLWEQVRGWLEPDDGALTDIHILGVTDLEAAKNCFRHSARVSEKNGCRSLAGRFDRDIGVNLYWFEDNGEFALELDVFAWQFGETDEELKTGFETFAELALKICEVGKGESCWFAQGVGINPREQGIQLTHSA